MVRPSALLPLATTGSASFHSWPAAGAQRARQARRAVAGVAGARVTPLILSREFARLSVVILVVTGLWLVGQVAWGPVKSWYAETLLERAFADSRTLGHPVRAWSWAEATPAARIRVPRLGVEEIVLSGDSVDASAFGPTLLSGSDTLGARGTAVFAGHRDTDFAFLADLRPGDLIEVEPLAGPTLQFRVVGADGFSVASDATGSSIAFTSRGGAERYVARARAESAGPIA